jgi:quercetin dioxygenase-like cupin family protein
MKPYSLGRDEGEAIWMFDALDTIKADAAQTGGALTAVEFLDFEGSEVPPHANARWHVGFYVLEGEYVFVLDDETVEASAGTWIFAPRGTTHSWRCESPRGRVLAVSTPGGFDAFYRDAGAPVADRTRLPARTAANPELLGRVAARHGIEIG